jgi:Zn-dependent metalloprotease
MVVNISPLCAQNAFDSKKKKTVVVNTTSLNAVRVNGSKSQNSSRAGSRLKQTPFVKPILQQPTHTVIFSSETGLPSFITSARENSSARKRATTDLQSACNEYLAELSPILHLEKPEEIFSVKRSNTDHANKKHIRLNQQYKGISVYGAEIVVHLNEYGEGEAFNGNYFSITENIDPVPVLSVQSAIEKVNVRLNSKATFHARSALEKKLVQYEQPHATLCIYQDKGLIKKFVLAYHIVSCPTLHQRWEYFVDATSGAVLHHFESTCLVDGPRTASGNDLNGVSRSVNTYQKGVTFFMLDVSRPMFKAAGSVLPDEPIGGILTIDMNNTFGDNQAFQHATSTNNSWATATQTKAVSAHFNAGFAYDYFRTKHNRNSIDGNGGTILSILNVTDETGGALDNAFWNGKAMFYGNGNTGFKPLAGSMDVAGHEMTHGVVENTANLEYQGESGAINESMADIFGAMMDPSDWLIGEDIVKTSAFPSGALRSLSDPHNGGTSLASPGFQPKHTNEAYRGAEDNGGVHINSGIPNHAFFKYAEAITRDKAAAVFYKALDDYLTKSSQFIDLRLAVIKAAGDLYGATSNEVTQAGLAFDAVGISSGQGGNYTETLPGNPGTEFLLVYNTDGADQNTLYRTTIDGASVTALSTTDFNSKPSITDNGEVAVFVAADHTIHVINLAASVATESVLQNQQIWSNVVVSKGGTKIAAVTTAQEPLIYVYDFATEVWSEFTLYNPTYTEGVTSAGPVYADALEWDYTGEYLVYDCFNRIDNSSGTDIEYWDVNFIRVWNNATNNFGDGTIAKLFPSLPDGVSVGNPSFAKNSPGIIAFDYIDATTEEYAVLGCNIETNEVNVVVSNNTLGWPSFNKNDSRIAFTSLDNSSAYQTNYVTLNSDKISSSTAAVGLFSDTKWPVYFTRGDREIEDKVITATEGEVENRATVLYYPNPFTDEISLMLTPSRSSQKIEIMNLLGQKVYELTTSSFANNEAVRLNLANLKSGSYIISVSVSRDVQRFMVTKK